MSDIERLTDAELVTAYRAGDSDAFAAIYDRYADQVFSHNLTAHGDREAAADATHDVFIAAATNIDELENPDQLGAWLRSISEDDAMASGGDLVEPTATPPAALRPRVLDKVDRSLGTTAVTRPANPEWMQIGLFVIVAVVVGLIGLAISAQFEPLELPPTTPGIATPPVAGASTSTTTTVGTSTTLPGGAPSTTDTAPAGPAVIEVSTDSVNFGEDGTSASFDITNTGGDQGEWSLVSSSDAVVLSAGEGSLGAGETVNIELSLDRETVEEGELTEMLTVTWAGGQIQIAVVGSNQANPIIHNPQATPPSVQVSGAPECANTQSTISARIRDASALESVVVEWSPDGSTAQEPAMDAVGNDMFEAVVGPFTTVHTATVRIVAIDEHGNAGGATTTVAVVECP